MSNITYNPDFKYKQDYSTIGSPVTSDTSITGDYNNTYIPSNERVAELLSKINRLQLVCIHLPKDISVIIYDLIIASRNIITKIEPSPIIDAGTGNNSGKNEENSESVDYHNGSAVNTDKNPGNNIDSNTDGYYIYPDSPSQTVKRKPTYDTSFKTSMRKNRDNIMPENYDIPVSDVKVGTTLDKIYYDTIDAYDDIVFNIVDNFTSQLSDVVSAYITNTLNMLKRNGMSGNIYDKYDKHTGAVSDPYKHMSDNIIRNEIIYDQNIRLAKKLFNYKSAMTHYISCDTNKKFCDRYKNEYKDLSVSLEAAFQRNTLEDALGSYTSKYENSLENMNRYFSSSVNYIGTNLDIVAQNAIYKAMVK